MRTPSLEVGGAYPVVNWESEPIEWNCLDSTIFQMLEMYMGNRNYKDDGAGEILLSSVDVLQGNAGYENQRASLVHIEKPSSLAAEGGRS